MNRSLPASVLFVVVAVAGLIGCADEPAKIPAPDATRVTIETAAGAFIGSAACADCHAEIYRRWESSRHHRSLVPATSEELAPWTEASLGDGYRVDPDGQVQGPGHDTVAVAGQAAFIVAGQRRWDLWVRLDDGRLQIFPYSVDLQEGRVYEHLARLSGGHSPPLDAVDYWTRIGRNADLSCYGCHATGSRLIVGKSDAGVTLRSEWAEEGVGCEACHGPGEAHVASARTDENPLPTPGDDAGGTCAACHGLHELKSSPFDREPAHVAGQPVERFADPALKRSIDFEFRNAFFADLRPRTYKQESTGLAQSRCAREGGLTCAHCHDTHSGTTTPALNEGRSCLPCHEALVDSAAAHSRHPEGSEGTRCTGCHMAPILAGPVATTAHDHSLAPTFAPAGTVPLACLNCHPAEGDEGSRVLQQWGSWTLISAEVQRRSRIAAAVLSAREPELGAAARLAALALDEDEADGIRFAAAELLAERLAAIPRPAAAARLAVLLDPGLPPALRRAAVRAIAASGAEDAADRLRPLTDDDDPQLAVAALAALVQLGEPLERELNRRSAEPALVADPRASLLAGKALLAGRRWAEAAETLQRAIDLYPFNVHAWNDLGMARLGLGEVEAARACWRQAIEINPRYEPARANLAAAAETLTRP